MTSENFYIENLQKEKNITCNENKKRKRKQQQIDYFFKEQNEKIQQ